MGNLLSTRSDIPYLATRWYAEKGKTCFGGADVEWTVEGCAIALEEALEDPKHTVCIEKVGGKIIAACASVINKTIIPPHPIVVSEYMWWGDSKKAVARVFKECEQWGRLHGATFSSYVLNQAQANPKKWVETYQWRAL